MQEKKEKTYGPRKENEGLPEQEHGTSEVKIDFVPEVLIAKEPELMSKLLEALQTERYFITVTFQKKYKPDDEHDLHHYYCRKNIMVNDIVPCLKHIASNFIAKENPTAEVPDKSQWH